MNANSKNRLVQDWTQLPQQRKRAKAAWERARTKYQAAEVGVAAAADILVSAPEAEKGASGTTHRVHEAGHRDREQEDGGGTARGAPQRDRQCREGVAARSDRSKSHAATNSDKDMQQHAREAEAGTRETLKVPKRRRIESMRSTDGGSNEDFDDDNDGVTTSEDEAMPPKDSNPSVLATTTGEDF